MQSSDKLPVARSGDTNAYSATMAEISTFSSVSVASGAYGNAGRNLLHNALFNIAQRGTGPFTGGTYNLDRWVQILSLDTVSVTSIALPDSARVSIGDEAAMNAYSNVFTGNAGAGAYNLVAQRVENLRRLSGKTVTVSFWAWCATGTLSLGVSIDQVTGTGGSPSANVVGTGQAQVISTTPTHYSKTFSVPSSTGLTLGTNNDHCTQLNIWFSSGSSSATRAGSIGVQSGNVGLWGVQLEIGTVATPLVKRDPADDLALCQRFYQTGNAQYYGYASGSISVAVSQAMPVHMRATPVVTPSFSLTTGTTGANVTAFDAQTLSLSATATGPFTLQATYTASADL